MRKMRVRIFVLVFLFLFSWGSIGMTADYPQRSIRMITPYGAGGGNDVFLRLFQPTFDKVLGQRMLIENIGGGSTKVGTMELIKAKPDGYTLIFSTTEAWIGYYYAGTYETKVWEQMTPIAIAVSEPYGGIWVRSESPFKTWADLVKAAKENPGKLTCGSTGVGGMLEMIMTDVSKVSGIKTPSMVPFAGNAHVLNALLGGHVDLMVSMPSSCLALYNARKIRGLAISSEKRMEFHPDVPTFKELGIGGTVLGTRSFWGPPKLPSNLVNTITGLIEKATKDPAFIKLAHDQLSSTVDYRSPQKTKEYVENFDKDYGPRLAEVSK